MNKEQIVNAMPSPGIPNIVKDDTRCRAAYILGTTDQRTVLVTRGYRRVPSEGEIRTWLGDYHLSLIGRGVIAKALRQRLLEKK